MTLPKRLAAGIAALALTLSLPAQAACWGEAERDAVAVRELQTMLMVASLRCHAMGIDIVADYDGFVQASRAALETANRTIKLHFAAEGSGQAEYDRFTTALANGYGDDATDPAACAEAATTARAAATSPGQMIRLAAEHVFPRALPGGTCGDPARAPRTAAAPPAILTIAAPPAAGFVRLPDEVIAALAVMARYNAGPVVPAAPPVLAMASAPALLSGAAR